MNGFHFTDRGNAVNEDFAYAGTLVRRCGRFFGPAMRPVLGFFGTASDSSSPASPWAVPRCSISDTRRACGRTRGPGRPTSRDGGGARSWAFRRSPPSPSCQAALLLRRRPDQAVPVADRDPSGPAAAAPAVGAGHRPPPLGKSPARCPEAGAGEPRVRARPHRPGRRPPSKRSGMGDGQTEPRDAGGPWLVGRGRTEVPADQVLRRIGDLALVGAASGPLLRVGDHETLLAHDAAHRLLGRDGRVVPRPRLVPGVAVAARPVGTLEDPAHASAEVGVLALPRQRLAPVLIGAPRHPRGGGGPFRAPPRRRPRLAYGRGPRLSESRPPPSACRPRAPAGAPGPPGSPRSRHAPLPRNLPSARSGSRPPPRGSGLRGSDPIVDNGGARHAGRRGDVPARHARPHERDRPGPRPRVVMAPRPTGPPLMRGVVPAQPLVQGLSARTSQPANRAGDRPAALLDRLEGPSPLPLRVARHSRTPNRTNLVQLFVRTPVPSTGCATVPTTTTCTRSAPPSCGGSLAGSPGTLTLRRAWRPPSSGISGTRPGGVPPRMQPRRYAELGL